MKVPSRKGIWRRRCIGNRAFWGAGRGLNLRQVRQERQGNSFIVLSLGGLGVLGEFGALFNVIVAQSGGRTETLHILVREDY